MYLYDYQTIKFEHQERIQRSAHDRVRNELRREARMVRSANFRSAVKQLAASALPKQRLSSRAPVPRMTGSRA